MSILRFCKIPTVHRQQIAACQPAFRVSSAHAGDAQVLRAARHVPCRALAEDALSANVHSNEEPPVVASTSARENDAAESVDDARELAIALAKVAWDTKGEDIVVLDVQDQASWCQYMVMVTVFSRPQLNAILGKMEKEASQKWGRRPYSNQGQSAWEVLDLGDVVVHVFGADLREYYDLESFYSTSEEVELPFLQEVPRQDDIEWQTSQRL